ncbi:MAG: hypothetical protein JXB45_07480 [Candidatus Krumholzibacteriota bacterium]|nr:hypothetical protein [Candidatus Krumholzibacteriota bacterium]
MSADLQLDLKPPRPEKGLPLRAALFLLILLMVMTALNLYLSLSKGSGAGRNGEVLPPHTLEELALKMEKQQLPGAAARIWTGYLASARPGREESARIQYRIGKLYQERGEFEKALEAYYRSEKIAVLKDIDREIAVRAAECLEKLGRFAALRSELESRTAVEGVSDPTSGEIVAEIGGWKISRAELESMIEAEIDAQLSSLAVGLTPQQKSAQKEKLLESVLARGEREKWMERFIAEELIYRYALEEKLYQEEKYRELLRNLERKLLVQALLDREFSRQVKVSEEELQDYYKRHGEKYTEEGVRQDFTEVRDQVYQAVRMEKEMQVQAQLLEGLRARYDVVIHRSRLEGK